MTQYASYCMFCASIRTIIHSLKLVDYLSIQTHKPYNYFVLFEGQTGIIEKRIKFCVLLAVPALVVLTLFSTFVGV